MLVRNPRTDGQALLARGGNKDGNDFDFQNKDSWSMWVEPNGIIKVSGNNGDTGGVVSSGPISWTRDKWYRIVLVHDWKPAENNRHVITLYRTPIDANNGVYERIINSRP